MENVAIIIEDITLMAGTERAVCNLANILADYGEYSSIIISMCTSTGKPAYTLHRDVKIMHLGISKYGNNKKPIYVYIQTGMLLNKICKEQDIDIVIGTNFRINASFIAVRNKGVIKIACEHMGSAAPISIFNTIVKRLVYPQMNSVVVLTSETSKVYGFCKNVSVIPNILPFIPKRQANLDVNVILAIGRLTYQKGFERLIEAIALIREKCLDWQVRIIGDGEDKDKLKKQIIDYELGGIINIISPTNRIEDEYCNASIYVMSSRYEGFGLVLIEAKSCGLPIISFDCPEGPADIIRDGIDGILVENGNVETLSQSILKMIENPQLRRLYGQEAIKDVERFLPKRIFEMWDDLFKRLRSKNE